MKTTKIKLEELTCPSCITNIENLLSKEAGVEKAQVYFNSSQVKVTYNEELVSEDHIKERIVKLGYPLAEKESVG